MNFFHAVVLGIVEGLTEFLPISSTGHLVLAAKWMGLSQTEFVKSFEIVIQGGAILSVVLLYGKKLAIKPAIGARVLAAFLPTAVVGYAFYKLIKKYLLAGDTVILWTLFLGGVVLVAFEWFYGKRAKKAEEMPLEAIPWRICVAIGLFQAMAVVPGVSRAAATILGGLILGLNRKTIVEFSFLLAVPTLLAATALDILKNGAVFSRSEIGLLLTGFVVSFAVGIVAIRFFIRYVQRHDLTVFGVYRIILALVFWVFVH